MSNNYYIDALRYQQKISSIFEAQPTHTLSVVALLAFITKFNSFVETNLAML